MTDQDRWWLAYCLLGTALVLRAPTIYWAAVVVIIWGVLLTVLSLRDVRNFLLFRKPESSDVEYHKINPDNTTSPITKEQFEKDAKQWPHRPMPRRATAEEVTERLAVIPNARPATVTPRADDDTIVLPDGAATAEMQPSGRVLVNLHGTVWTTETMLVAILDAIGQARGRGETEL